LAFIKPIGYDQAKCGKLIEARGLAGIVVTSNENVFYTTGLPATRGQVNPILFALSNQFPSYSVIPPDGKPTMVCWTGSTGGHEFWVEDVRSAWMRGGTTEELLACVKEKFKPGDKIGLESSCPHFLAETIARLVPSSQLVFVDDIFEGLRSVKSEAEVRLMKESLAIAEGTVARLQQGLDGGTSGHRLISDAKRIMFELGASGVDHTTIGIGHSNPEIPEDVQAKTGDLIVLDVGAILHGYCSDNRRLAYMGKLPEPLRAANDAMVRVVMETGRSVRKGMTFSQVCETALVKYQEYGQEPMFVSVGHTIGLQTEEIWLTSDPERWFETGMVYNVELYARTESNEFVGTEDTFYLAEDGPQMISTLPHDVAEVRG
jgi:Xaa-Pro aminopeptidase